MAMEFDEIVAYERCARRRKSRDFDVDAMVVGERECLRLSKY